MKLYGPYSSVPRCRLVCEDESRAVQSEKDNCDINVILKRFGITGSVPQDVRVPLTGDFTAVMDFSSAMTAIRSAQESFDAMAADVRARFNNDPQLFLEFCADKSNFDEMRRMGLAVPKPVIPPATPS